MLQIGTSDSSHVTAFLHEKSATLVIHFVVFQSYPERLILLILSILYTYVVSWTTIGLVTIVRTRGHDNDPGNKHKHC